MKILEELVRRKRKLKARNERGSVTLFVLIAMLFFLIVGLIIFMSNMNNSTTQQRDVKKIQSEYNNIDTGKLDDIYEEQEKKQTGKLLISVTDSYNKIYESGKWVNITDSDRLPLTIEVTWPEGSKDSEKEISITGTINGQNVEITIANNNITGTGPVNIANLIDAKDDKCKIGENVTDCNLTITAKVNDRETSVNIKVDTNEPTGTISPNGGEEWIDKDKGQSKSTINAAISTADTNGSGVKEVYYKWSTSETTGTTDGWIEGDTKPFNVTNEVGEGVYYLHVKIVDNSGNVAEEVSEPYVVKEANYRIETQGKADKYAETLEEAISKCENGKSKIVVVQDCTDNSVSVEIDKNLTIDTNGYTLTINHSIDVESGKQLTITDNKNGENKGKIYNSSSGNLIDNSGTVVVNGAIVEAVGVAIDGGNVTVASGTVKGGTSAIKNTSDSCTITIGDSNSQLSNTSPIIEATNGKAIEITKGTTQLNFYNGKLIGTDKTTVRGVDVAFGIEDASKAKYREGYGAHTDKVGTKYETTLVVPIWNVTPTEIYLNTTDNKTKDVEVTGIDIGTITYTTGNKDVVEVQEKSGDNKKATVTSKGDGQTTITVKDENSGTTKQITIVTDSTKPTITVDPANTGIVGKKVDLTITAADQGGSGLATNNSYQYAVSESSTTAPQDGWTNYTSGQKITLGTNETKTFYVWVKEVKDKSENVSTQNGTKVGTNHVFGPYVVDNAAPEVTFTPNGNTTYAKAQNSKVTVADVGPAGLDTASLKYQWTQSETAPAENTFTQSFSSGDTLSKNGVTGNNWYLWILAKDTVGNQKIIKSEAFYIDNKAPIYTEAKIENVTTTGYDVVVTEVDDEHAGMGSVKVRAWTTVNDQDDIKQVDAVKQSDNTTWKVHVNVTDHSSQYGEYNTIVKLVDSVGNEVETTLNKVTVPGVKITFDTNYGETPTTTEITKGYGAPLGTLPTPERTGYSLVGWFTERENGDQISTTTTVPENDTTYYAHWEAITYTIEFDKNNDSATGTMENMIMVYDEEKQLIENAFERTGYTFGGWNTKADGTGTSYEDKASVKNLTSENNATVTLYAKWIANNYTIKFDKNGGTGTMADESMTYDVEKALTKNTFTKEGYTFAGWSLANEGYENRLLYSNNAEKTGSNEFMQYADLAPYIDTYGTNAKYRIELDIKSEKEGSNTIKAYFQNGSTTRYAFEHNITNVSNEWKHIEFDFSAVRTSHPDTKAMLAFYGTYGTGNKPCVKNVRLYIVPNYTDEQVVKNLTSEKDGEVTLYANWEANKYQIVFNKNAENATGTMENQQFTYGQAQNLTENGFSRVGYTFGGWNTLANGTGTNYADKASVSNLTTEANGTVNLYAKWTIITYNISYELNGGALESGKTNPTTYNVESGEITLNNPVRNGYTFKGWSGTGLTGDTNKTVKIPAGSTGDRSYTANWELETYHITYTLPTGAALESGKTNPETYTIESAKITLNNPVKSGWEFKGWSGTGLTGDTNKTVEIPTGSTGDRSYVAHFEKEIKLTQKHGRTTTEQTYKLQDSETEHEFTLVTTQDTFPGWTFRGWLNAVTPKEPDYEPTGKIKISADKTVYATYSQDFTATFIDYEGTTKKTRTETARAWGNNGCGGVGNQYGTITIPTQNTYTGWTVAGWTTENTANATAQKNSGDRISLASNPTYYGLYTQNVELTYNANNGTPTPAKQTGLRKVNSYDTTIFSNPELTLADAITKSGYNFAGWAVSAPISATKDAGSKITPTSGTSLTATAQWSLVTYTISYVMNGGTNDSSNPTSYNIETENITLKDATRANYVFAGWTGNGTTNPTKGLVLEKGNTGDKTFTANWTEANYSVTTSGNNIYYYLTLTEAISRADASGSTITVLKTCDDTSESVTVDKNITINTNGKTATMASTITVSDNKTLTISGNGTIKKTSGDLITNNGTVVVSGANLEGGANGINGGNVTVTTGTVKGGTNGINITSANSVVTIGTTTNPTATTPAITGTTGYGINITQSTSTLNFYSGKIIGKTTGTTKGVTTAYSVAGTTNYPTGYGAHTVQNSSNNNLYETTLAQPTLTLSPEVIYLNLNNNTTGQITASGSNYGTLSYSSNNETVARVSNTGAVEAKAAGEATITVTESNGGKTATCRVVVDTTLPIWTITVKQIQ